MIKNSDLPPLEKLPLPYLVKRDWLERLCTLNVLADHGDLDASDTLRAWCAHDPEAREVRVALTTALRAVQLADDR